MKIKLNEYMFLTINKEILEPDEFGEFMTQLNVISKIVKRDFLSNEENVSEKTKLVKLEKTKSTRQYVKSGKYKNGSSEIIETKNNKPLQRREWCDSKEKVIKLLKIHYFGSKEDKNEIAKKIGLTWTNINKSFYNIKNRFNIQPKDIGLKRFPTSKELINKTNRKEVISSLKL